MSPSAYWTSKRKTSIHSNMSEFSTGLVKSRTYFNFYKIKHINTQTGTLSYLNTSLLVYLNATRGLAEIGTLKLLSSLHT